MPKKDIFILFFISVLVLSEISSSKRVEVYNLESHTNSGVLFQSAGSYPEF